MTVADVPAATGAAILEARDLRARYGEIEAVKGVDLCVPRGAIVALLGANGSGKTSTLRALTGAIKTTGSVAFDGRPLAQRTPEAAAKLGIAHVPEGRGTLAALTVWENLMLGAYLERSGANVRRRCERVAAYFPWITERKNQPAGTLSGGEQQMLAIARALMLEPQLLLLDEPSLGLGPKIVHDIFALLRTINESDGISILVAEQNATVALAVAQHAYVLETGRVAVEGPSADLVQNDRVRRSYLGY
ncbi:MAG TPA: ABC transporter ATP-binding protein [Candidatus Elarobacter sp.]|jgi:branched-chain amino acid transport system ATP-binding protein|nr:ABC transporter ATP-binding protein [Candidatus Elarobacter sp.]